MNEQASKDPSKPGADSTGPASEKKSGATADKAATPSSESDKDESLLENASVDLKALAQNLEDAKKKAEENWNQYLRARADMENIRRRAEIDVENAHKYSIERFAKEMLYVVDSLEHGLQVADSVKDKAYHEGMELTLKLCLDNFEKFGIKKIEPPVGDAFDPLRHEAISTQLSDEYPPNKVMVVAQRGFMLHDRVLRPARVVVSRKPTETESKMG